MNLLFLLPNFLPPPFIQPLIFSRSLTMFLALLLHQLLQVRVAGTEVAGPGIVGSGQFPSAPDESTTSSQVVTSGTLAPRP